MCTIPSETMDIIHYTMDFVKGLSVQTVHCFHGQCPLNPLVMSRESIDNVQGVHWYSRHSTDWSFWQLCKWWWSREVTVHNIILFSKNNNRHWYKERMSLTFWISVLLFTLNHYFSASKQILDRCLAMQLKSGNNFILVFSSRTFFPFKQSIIQW